MIDCQEIEELLKETKLNSMSDVIHFVIENVYKMMSFDPIEELNERINELEKPKGLDQIMLQEVKTLMEAMFEQKQEWIAQQMHHRIELDLEGSNSRGSLKEIDMSQLFNSQSHDRKRGSRSNGQQESEDSHSLKMQAMQNELCELRSQLERKPDRRELNEASIKHQREISTKMSIVETEKVVEKFQRSVFDRLNETTVYVQKMEYELKKSLLDQVSELKREFWDTSKFKELKSASHKLSKRVQKIQSEFGGLSSSVKEESKQLQGEMKEYIKQVVVLIEGLNDDESERQCRRSETRAEWEARDQEKFNQLSKLINSPSAVWLAQHHFNSNNMAVIWSQELKNTDGDQFRFEHRKSKLMVERPGYYEVSCRVSGCDSPPSFLVNSQFFARFQSKNNGLPLFSLSEIVKLQSPQSLVEVRLESGNRYESAFLRIVKIL